MNRTTANNDHTVLSLACAGGHLAVVELLLAHGADPTHRLKVGTQAVRGVSNSIKHRELSHTCGDFLSVKLFGVNRK